MYLPFGTRIIFPAFHFRGQLHGAEEELLESVFGHVGLYDAVDYPRKGVHGVDQHLQQRNGCGRKTETSNENMSIMYWVSVNMASWQMHTVEWTGYFLFSFQSTHVCLGAGLAPKPHSG